MTSNQKLVEQSLLIAGYSYKLVHPIIRRISIPDSHDKCWIWNGYRNDDGYGRMKICGKTYTIHRKIYEFYYGPFDNQKYVCHDCDIPCCTNPRHLFLGTQQDNMDDMKQKNRSTHGSNSFNAILTEDIVEDILIRINNREFSSIKQIALIYNIKRHSIGKILNGKLWKRVVQKVNIPLSVLRSNII